MDAEKLAETAQAFLDEIDNSEGCVMIVAAVPGKEHGRIFAGARGERENLIAALVHIFSNKENRMLVEDVRAALMISNLKKQTTPKN